MRLPHRPQAFCSLGAPLSFRDRDWATTPPPGQQAHPEAAKPRRGCQRSRGGAPTTQGAPRVGGEPEGVQGASALRSAPARGHPLAASAAKSELEGPLGPAARFLGGGRPRRERG